MRRKAAEFIAKKEGSLRNCTWHRSYRVGVRLRLRLRVRLRRWLRVRGGGTGLRVRVNLNPNPDLTLTWHGSSPSSPHTNCTIEPGQG